MGNEQAALAINEAVFLLAQMAPEKLKAFQSRYPALAGELQQGIFAGTEDEQKPANSFLIQKAEVVTGVLEEASSQAEKAMSAVAADIKRARMRRLASQVLVLIGSSSLLGAVALDGKTATVVSAVITLLAALGNLMAEHYEKLLNPQSGNIYEVFQRLGEGAYKARRLAAEIQLAARHQEDATVLRQLVGNANELCEQLNGWLIQVINRYPATLAAPSR